jgi:hypothetical protein
VDIETRQIELPPLPEPVGGDAVYYVDSVRRWRELTNFTVAYEDTSDYWRPKIKQRSMYMDALAKAQAFFRRLGALEPIVVPEDAVEVHVHPKTHQVVFVFRRAVAGATHECAVPYPMTPPMVGWLKATGRWKDHREH